MENTIWKYIKLAYIKLLHFIVIDLGNVFEFQCEWSVIILSGSGLRYVANVLLLI